MITGIILFSILVFIAMISYKRPRLEHRVFKNIPLIDWLTILLFPIIGYFSLAMIVVNILTRPGQIILDFEDITLVLVGILFLVYAIVGNSIHFVGKVLSRYISSSKYALIYKINEIFHGKLSHYLFYVCTIMTIFIISLLEINHPLSTTLSKSLELVVITSGVLLGLSSAKGIYYSSSWYGGYNKALFFLVSVLLIIQLSIFSYFNLKFRVYPVNIFIMSMYLSFLATFIARQFFIFSRLGKKRKLQFLAKIFSA